MSKLAENKASNRRVVRRTTASEETQKVFGGNWEERLAAARAQREKIQREKEQSAEAKNVDTPAFLSTDPAAQWEQSRDSAVDSLLKHDAVSANDMPNPLPVGRKELLSDFRNFDAVERPKPKPSAMHMAGVAFVCFFGLGFGMVLSLGAVLALGWIPFPEFTVEEEGEATPSPTFIPEVSSIDADAFTGSATASGAPELLMSNDVSAETTNVQRDAPDPLSGTAPDVFAADAQLSAPKPDDGAFSAATASRLDFQPASLATTFVKPVQTPEAPATRLTRPDLSGDSLPQLPEVSNIDTGTVVATLKAPVQDEGAIALAAVGDEVFAAKSVSSLAVSVPDTVPSLLDAAPTDIEVLDRGVPERFASLDLEADLGTPATTVEDPPVRTGTFTLPDFQETALNLPEIGTPHQRVPESASVSLSGVAGLGQISLVKIAPTNVTESRMSEMAETLSAAGVQVSSVDRVNYRVSQTHTRYYNRQDEEAAQQIAAAVGGVARDFTNFASPPPPGLIELYLEGQRRAVRTATAPRTTATAAAATTSTRTNTERREELRSTLTDRVIDNLRTDGIFQR